MFVTKINEENVILCDHQAKSKQFPYTLKTCQPTQLTRVFIVKCF